MISSTTPSVGVLIPCHNEAQNISRLLAALPEQLTGIERLIKVVIISSASTDGTDEHITQFALTSNLPITLIAENSRKGKAAAVNRGISELGQTDLVVLMSADILPGPSCIRALVGSFNDPAVGVAGGQPLVKGPSANFIVRLSTLLWQVHHEIALISPKSTEITVFRNVGGLMINEDTLVDEAEIECRLCAQGFRVVYVPHATIFTQSPTRLWDYFQQRMRVTQGHLILSRKYRYTVGSLNFIFRISAIKKVIKARRPGLSVMMFGIMLEAMIMICALISIRIPVTKTPVWKRIESAKRQFDEIV